MISYYRVQGFRLGQLLMSFHDAVCLPSRASFSATFLKNCGRGEVLRTTTYPITVGGGKQGHAACKIHLFQQIILFVSVEFQ